MRALLIILLAAGLLVGAGLWMGRRMAGSGGGGRIDGQPTREFDVSVMDVATARLVAGPPGSSYPCLPDETAAAVDGLARRLAESGFGPAMRRGTRPRPTVAVVERVPYAERRAPSAGGTPADCALHLALSSFELLEWSPPAAGAEGRASFLVEGRVWAFVPGDGSGRTFLADIAGRHDASFGPDELAGAPPGAAPALAAAHLYGYRLLETMQRGLVWLAP